jgi:hypothetical protein
MNKISHSKYKNTGIIFELLVRSITTDTLRGNDSPALTLIKKYFVKSELGKEYKLYESAIKSQKLNEGMANIVISTILESSKKLNRRVLKNEKYNLIKEIKENYNIDFFFSSKINNYKPIASIYTLIESSNSSTPTDPDQINQSKGILLEYLTEKVVTEEKGKGDILEEYSQYDKDLRILTYRIMLEKFNSKYSNLNVKQKDILKEFINSADNSPRLKKFFNKEIKIIKEDLTSQISITKDEATKIKLQEVQKHVKTLGKNDKIKTFYLIDLLQYCDLLENLKEIHE